jgi:hypothetical protein
LRPSPSTLGRCRINAPAVCGIARPGPRPYGRGRRAVAEAFDRYGLAARFNIMHAGADTAETVVLSALPRENLS